MYGMIHCAVREMFVEQLGATEWAALERAAKITAADQISFNVYDDALTMRILEEAAARLGLDLQDCLEEFGRYWIVFAGKGSFKSMMEFTGDDIITFISNLDQMHRSVVRTLTKAQMPSFQVLEKGEGYFTVLYLSERNGLGAFVTGLLKGLLDHFNQVGDVKLIKDGPVGLEYKIWHRDGP
jgi:guanylate cyclase soluble subunit beta